MTLYIEVLVFGALLGLPFLYETRPAFCYCLKFLVYYTVVMFNSVILIPVFLLRPWSVLNLVWRVVLTLIIIMGPIVHLGMSHKLIETAKHLLVLSHTMYPKLSSQELFKKIASYFCRWITHLIGVKWELRNGEILEPQEPCIIVSNHQSSLDILGMFQIWSTMGRCTVIAKKELFWAWPFGMAAWLAGLVFIPRVKTKAEQAKAVINDAVEKVAQEKTKLWIFPEGTRRNTGEIHPFKKGAFHSAILAQLPVIPVVFSNYYFLDRPNKKFEQGVVIVKVLEPLSTKGLTLDDVEKFTDLVYEKMSQAFHQINREALTHRESSKHSANFTLLK